MLVTGAVHFQVKTVLVPPGMVSGAAGLGGVQDPVAAVATMAGVTEVMLAGVALPLFRVSVALTA